MSSLKPKYDLSKYFDLFQATVINPQVAMLSFLNMASEMAKHPEKIENARKDLVNRFIDLADYASKKIMNQNTDALEVKTNDRRFKDPEWNDNPTLNIIKQFYLSLSSWMLDSINDVEGVDRKLHQQANFYLKQYIDALHPSNFPMLNPSVVKKTIEENGRNLEEGFKLLMEDLKKGAITTNDEDYYTLGDNIANSKGKVVFRNYLIELIQYEPTTEKVHKIPVLFIPSWINKYYILDLGKGTSMVEWLVSHGFTVFMISWVNPDERYRNIGFEEYATDGIISAINKIADITQEKLINAVGYCIGGTLLSALLAALNDKNCKIKPKMKITSATLLATLLDFDQAGDLAAFMEDRYLKLADAQMKKMGYLDGKTIYNTFCVLKANDMIWRYMIESYMLGNKPPHHSTLFWNADSVNNTETMQTFLSKCLYRDNKLKKKELNMFGVPVDISKIKQPMYMVSTLKDHLVPWNIVFNGFKLLNTAVKFVVGGSGHVAGIINHPSKQKYNYWTNEKNAYDTAADWMSEAVEHANSWWTDWTDWLAKRSGDMIKARNIINSLYDAPGHYVLNEHPDCEIQHQLNVNNK